VLIRSWRFVTLLLVALTAGMAFAHLLERPAKMLYDGVLYSTVQRTLYVQWGWPNIGGIVELAAVLSAVVLVFLVRNRKPAVALSMAAAITLLLAFPVMFLLFVGPANDVFLASAAESAAPNWRTMRESWELGHTIRFYLQLAALSLLLLSVVIETREDTVRSA
jgi:hypothetical protein